MHHLNIIVVSTKTWKSRDEKHARMKLLMEAGGTLKVSFTNALYKGTQPKITDGAIDYGWFEDTLSKNAKSLGYNHVIFHFSLREASLWGITSTLFGRNLLDGDYFGESWVKCDENTKARFKDGTLRNRYEKDVPHEIGHELYRRSFTPLLMHDYDYKDIRNNLEKFYKDVRIVDVSNTGIIAILRDKLKQLLALQASVTNQPLVQRKADAVIAEMARLGHAVRIVQGYRSREEQDKLYAQGRITAGAIVTQAKGGESLHNYGVAVDFVFRKEGYNASSSLWDLLGKVGKAQGFEWGGDSHWIKAGFVDRPHFQMKLGYSLADFQKNKIDWKKYQ